MMTRQAIERWVGARPFNWVANWIDWYLKVKLLFCCVEIRIMHFRILATTATTRRGRSIYAICTHLKHQRAEIKKTNPLILLKTQNFPKNFGNYCNYISRAQDNFFQPHWIHHIPAGGTGKYNEIAISSCLQPIVQTNVADCVCRSDDEWWGSKVKSQCAAVAACSVSIGEPILEWIGHVVASPDDNSFDRGIFYSFSSSSWLWNTSCSFAASAAVASHSLSPPKNINTST